MADTQAFEYQTVSITSGNMLPQPKEKRKGSKLSHATGERKVSYSFMFHARDAGILLEHPACPTKPKNSKSIKKRGDPKTRKSRK